MSIIDHDFDADKISSPRQRNAVLGSVDAIIVFVKGDRHGYLCTPINRVDQRFWMHERVQDRWSARPEPSRELAEFP
jgi:hypothetical protein